jgi:mannose-6-phosphate isomerase-like protein (cupin superfamily)
LEEIATMRKLTMFMIPTVLALLLCLSFQRTVSGHDLKAMAIASNEGPFFSESPVPGVKIIRLRDYDKRPAHYLSSSLYTTLEAGRESLNRFVVFDFQTPAGGGPLPHTHKNEWEAFFVQEGTVTFTVGVRETAPGVFEFIEIDVHAGTLVYGPQGPVHGFINKSGQPARIFSVASPAGLDNFFVTSGDRVTDFDAPIPPIGLDEILRTAFWAEQRGDALYPPGIPGPIVPDDTPADVISTITGQDITTGGDRPTFTGPFGETHVSLLSAAEAGSITGGVAWCGPVVLQPQFGSRNFGGTVDYSYFELPAQRNFPDPATSDNIEVFYTLDGRLTFKFGDKKVTVGPMTYVKIDPGIPYSIANKNGKPAKSLAISFIAPLCPETPPGLPVAGPAGGPARGAATAAR